MKERTKRKAVPTRFARPTRFAVALASSKFWGRQAVELEGLKGRLLQPLLARTYDPVVLRALERAAQDAAALAWSMSPFALLFFPGLLEEKAAEALAYARYQEQIWERNQQRLGKAA
jgi:hypothetical protein